ncbi:MAG: HAMP domain-containing histidine kinase [Thermoanaerobaculia bacterium]|nr:HAMP domain-containing histidine kinase [Thermoanaerobaculia bacterium]
MTLRVKLFALMGGLLALMVGAEWLLVEALTRDLRVEVTAVATSVGKDVVKVLQRRDGKLVELGGVDTGVRRIVVRDEAHVVSLPPSPPEARAKEGTTGPEVSPKEVEGPRFVVTTVQTDGNRTTSATESWTTKGGTGFIFLEGPVEKVKIPIPGTGVKEAVGRFRTRLLLGSLGIVGVGLLAAAFVAHRVTRPLVELSRAARTVGEGAFGAQVAAREGGEVGEAIAAFNQMSSRLASLEREALDLKEREHLGEMGEVARGMAHALRNPLHAVGLSVDELAARLPDDAEAASLAAAARRQIAGVDGTIRSFLALAAGGGTEEEVDVRSLAEDVALAALQEARGRVRVTVSPASGAMRLRAVAPELKAALHALVVNAVEASADGAEVSVRVEERAQGGVRVSVEDEGPGLPEEVAARLFTPHVTTKPSGSGMGLYLAHRIATMRYGGSLVLERRAPRGTRALLEAGPRAGGRPA